MDIYFLVWQPQISQFVCLVTLFIYIIIYFI